MKHLFSRRRKITVALSLEENSEELFEIARQFATKFNKELNLVHVTEPWFGSFGGIPLAHSESVSLSGMAVMEARRDRARDRLNSLAVKYDKPGVEVKLYEGDPEKWITAESQESFATILGTRPAQTKLGRRFSMIARALAHSQSPAMIVPKGWEFPKSRPLKILVADDLEAQSESSVEFAMSLAAAFGNCAVNHVHVSGLSLSKLTEAIETVSASARTPLMENPSPIEIHRDTMDSLKENLKERSKIGELEGFEKSGCSYNCTVLSGPTAETIEQLREEIQPDIEIYGKHKAFHTKPFGFGTMPITSMMTGKALLISVPEK